MPTHPSDNACCPTSSSIPPGPAIAQHSQALRPAVVAPSSPQSEAQEAWAWASDELKQKVRATFHEEARTGELSPARRFGFGAIGLGETLGLSPNRKLEKLEATQDNLTHRVQALETSSHSTGAAVAKAAKSRRGRKRRDGGLTCEEQMLLLAETDLTVMILKPPGIHARMVARWGKENAFSIRKIQGVPLYKDWQFEVEKLRKELKMSPADFTEEGLAILSHKPGREDKRRVGRAQHEQATRMFLARMSNANIAAKRGSEAAKAARDHRGRQ